MRLPTQYNTHQLVLPLFIVLLWCQLLVPRRLLAEVAAVVVEPKEVSRAHQHVALVKGEPRQPVAAALAHHGGVVTLTGHSTAQHSKNVQHRGFSQHSRAQDVARDNRASSYFVPRKLSSKASGRNRTSDSGFRLMIKAHPLQVESQG